MGWRKFTPSVTNFTQTATRPAGVSGTDDPALVSNFGPASSRTYRGDRIRVYVDYDATIAGTVNLAVGGNDALASILRSVNGGVGYGIIAEREDDADGYGTTSAAGYIDYSTFGLSAATLYDISDIGVGVDTFASKASTINEISATATINDWWIEVFIPSGSVMIV